MFYAALTATAFMFFFGMGYSNLKKNIRIILLVIGWAFFGLHSYIIGQIAMQYTVWQICGYLLFLSIELVIFLFMFQRIAAR